MSESRPVIGIVTAVEQARHGAWNEPSALLHTSYVEAVQQAGAIALMIPPDPALSEDPGPILDRIDGLLLAGGSDLDPASYDAVPHPLTIETTPARDETEVVLARAARERDMPVLGICRGMQVLNVALGGTLVQHVPEVVGHEEHRRHLGTFADNEHVVVLARAALERDMPVLGICRGMQVLNVALGGTLVQHVPEAVGHEQHRRHLGTFVDNDHIVMLEPGSLAAQAAGEERHVVKSHHHQAVAGIGEGLIVTGRSELDELPEAIESPEHEYVLGVQWHPEADPASAVVGSLVQRAAELRGSAASAK